MAKAKKESKAKKIAREEVERLQRVVKKREEKMADHKLLLTEAKEKLKAAKARHKTAK